MKPDASSGKGSPTMASIPLTGCLAEFRTALRQELDAAKRQAADDGVAIKNGHLVGHMGGSFIYAFTLESILNLPSDCPAGLQLPGGLRFDVVVLSLSGLRITFSVSSDLGPAVPSGVLITNPAFLLERLIQRIEQRAAGQHVISDRLLQRVEGAPVVEINRVRESGLNPQQRLAVASALIQSITFVWGPPGTGKTKTIGAIARHLLESQRSVLVVSHTNVAVDQALLQVASGLTPDALSDGKVLRLGTPVDPRLVNEGQDLLLETHVGRRSMALHARLTLLRAERSGYLSRVTDLRTETVIAEWLAIGLAARKKLHENVARLKVILPERMAIHARAKEVASLLKSQGLATEQRATLRDEHQELEEVDKSLWDEEKQLRTGLQESLKTLLERFVEWGIEVETDKTLKGNFAAVEQACTLLKARCQHSLDEIQTEVVLLETRAAAVSSELSMIEEQLSRVRDQLLMEAMLVGTTLTQSYLSDTLNSRQFDTVILDEASMAPIPALWVAACLAKTSATVVGDFMQLGPIVLSDAPEARRWLGRDLFSIAGATDTDALPAQIVVLKEQHRMHPQITKIVNEFVYGNLLENAPTAGSDRGLTSWYTPAVAPDEPVCVIDTHSLDAWVTPVRKGKRQSKVNFISASLCVELARRALSRDQLDPETASTPRILIISPYRPHASLIQMMLREQKLDDVVRAGTAHSFQGSEADVVILDLVNDDPVWKVGHFVPAYDETTRRLFNVAITRARSRLFIVGDLHYIMTKGKKAFLGKDLLPFIKSQYSVVDAKDIAPLPFMSLPEPLLQGVGIEPSSFRASSTFMTQEDFDQLFVGDLCASLRRIVLFSPFITDARVSYFSAHLQAASERGVVLHVVTKPLEERGKKERENYRVREQLLESCGAIVCHKKGMHEKVIFVDDDIVWLGSLNVLSHSNTAEFMARLKDRQVVDDIAKKLHLRDLIAEIGDKSKRCPLCEQELIACGGGSNGFFVRCASSGCFTRSVGDPPLVNGRIVCSRCQHALELQERAGKFVWSCLSNKSHSEAVRSWHFKLTVMLHDVAKDIVKKVKKAFAKKA